MGFFDVLSHSFIHSLTYLLIYLLIYLLTYLLIRYMNLIAEETMRVTLGTKKIIEGLEAGLYKYQRNETGYIIISPRLGAH